MVASRTAKELGSHAETQGIRIRVTPRYLAEHSAPGDGQWVFAYRVHITNEGSTAARVIARKWIIRDAEGEEEIVEGPGIVGLSPRIEPGRSHDYESFCPLTTPWGTMQGHYVMRRDDGTEFLATIARFFLAVEEA